MFSQKDSFLLDPGRQYGGGGGGDLLARVCKANLAKAKNSA